MALQFKLTNRRQFLGRSALGAGSLLFGPLLLESCTDHIIPDPTKPPPKPPLLGDDDSTDWNDDAKTVVTTGLSLIPEVGGIISGLVTIFWPNGDNTVTLWGQIEDQVNQLINQKLDTYTYSQATGKLDDLRDNMQDYLDKLKSGTPSEINTYWIAVKEAFVTNKSVFTTEGYEVMLLPLYALYTNMYLSLLRDPVMTARDAQGNPVLYNGGQLAVGQLWGMDVSDIVGTTQALGNFITEAQTHVSTFYTAGLANVVNNTPVNNHLCEPFRSTNAYNRQMTMSVLDYMNTWTYYNINNTPFNAINPDGTPNYLFTREIYSDPYGSCDDSGPIVITTPVPTQLPTKLIVWGYDRIDAVQLFYPPKSGPGGVDQTLRMGDQPDGKGSGGSTQDPHGGIFDLTIKPITKVRVIYDEYVDYKGGLTGPIVTGLQFMYDGGSTTSLLANQNLNSARYPVDTGLFGFAGQALSSIHINGVNNGIGSADCIVFGFMRWPRG